jgi:hypothetical protein
MYLNSDEKNEEDEEDSSSASLLSFEPAPSLFAPLLSEGNACPFATQE